MAIAWDNGCLSFVSCCCDKMCCPPSPNESQNREDGVKASLCSAYLACFHIVQYHRLGNNAIHSGSSDIN